MDFNHRIEELRKCKKEITRNKIEKEGYHDTDDHGYILFDEPIPFKVVPNHPDGKCYGSKAIGENFKNWLEVHPIYINPMSALAGCWAGVLPEIRGFKPEDKPYHLYPTHKKYNIMANGIEAMNHISPDMRIGLDLGWGGLLEKIRYYRKLNRPADTSFYDGEEALVLGVQRWIKKHAEQAIAMAESEKDPETRENLLKIAETNEWLVEGPPRNLREACQFLAWFQSIDRMWFLGGALGQLDELLRPYYEKDKESGIDDEEVIWYIASLFFNDTHYYQIGGADVNGNDLTSEMSFLILEAMHRLRIPCNLAVRVHDNLNPELLNKAVTYLFEDGTGVAYSCSKGLDEGYVKNGVPMQLARMRAKVGCNWTALPGIEYCLQDVTRVCLISPFLHAFNEVAKDSEEKTMEALWEHYSYHLEKCVEVIKEGFDWHIEHKADNMPEIVLNLFMHGPIERGLDASAGGVDIYNMTCDGVGLATVADSFAAVEQRVVNEKKLSWDELAEVLDKDFENQEDVRLMLKNIPRYGTGNSRADYWAKRISKLYTDLVKQKPTPKGINVIPGLFSHGTIAALGENLGATPNGRHAHAPISHSADPDPGFMPDGGTAPTAKANAVASVQPGYGNSAPLQIDFDKNLAEYIGGIEAIEHFIKVHNLQGGTLININIISKEQILEAHNDPEKYPDLVVRVTGYSAFFRLLSPEYRQQVVDRLLV